MKLTLQYFSDCPNRQILEDRVRALTAGRRDVSLERQLVETTEDAERLGFVGSPTLLINGVDPFAEPGRPAGLTCRVYQTPEGLAGSPSTTQLAEVLAAPGSPARH